MNKFPFASYEDKKTEQSHLADCSSFNIYEINQNPEESIILDAMTMVFTIDHPITNSAIGKMMGPDQEGGFQKFTQILKWSLTPVVPHPTPFPEGSPK